MTPCALLFHFSGYTLCDVNVNNRTGVLHLWMLCIYTLRTCHLQDCKLYFSLDLCHSNSADVWSMTLYWVYLALILYPSFSWQIKQRCMSMIFLLTPNYVWSYCVIPPHLPKQMAIFQPINPYLLSLVSLFLTSIIMYSPCLTLLFSPSASDQQSVHHFPTSHPCPAFCSKVDFTLLMFVMPLLFSEDVKSTYAAKPLLNSLDF